MDNSNFRKLLNIVTEADIKKKKPSPDEMRDEIVSYVFNRLKSSEQALYEFVHNIMYQGYDHEYMLFGGNTLGTADDDEIEELYFDLLRLNPDEYEPSADYVRDYGDDDDDDVPEYVR